MGLFNFRKKSIIPTGIFTPVFFNVRDVERYLAGTTSQTDAKYLEYYQKTPELQAVINYRARCLAGMDIEMRSLKTGEDIESDPILTLLDQPNLLQTGSEFIQQYSTYRDIFGNDFIYMLFGTDISKTSAMWNLPPVDAEVIINKDINLYQATAYYEIIKEYKFLFDNKDLVFPPEEVIHFFDNNIYDGKKITLKGSSKLQPLTQVLSNIITSYEARGVILGNSPLGILSNETQDASGSVPMNPKDKIELQEAYKKYGVGKEKYSQIITNARLKWQSMATAVTEQHFTEVTSDLKAICNAYAFPPDLILSGSTYENIKEAKKQFYQDTIIPEAKQFLDGLNSAFGLYEQGKELYPSFDDVAVLQDDYEKKTRMWNTATMAVDKSIANGTMTIEEGREVLEKIGMI